jgi:hypothetical protein
MRRATLGGSVHHLVAPVEQAQYTALKQRSEGDRDDKGRGEHHRIAEEGRTGCAAVVPARSAGRGVGADGVQTAMSEVDNIDHAEHEREPDHHDEQPGRVDQFVYKDRRCEVHAPSRRTAMSKGAESSLRYLARSLNCTSRRGSLR